MIKRIFRMIRGGVLACVVTSVSVFGSLAAEQEVNERRLTVYLQGVFSAKVSLTPFEGKKAIKPIDEVSGVKTGETAVIKIPAQYLPGEFVLRLDYSTKEGDHPYPAERVIYINNQDIELSVNPPYINSDKTKFNEGETENTVYTAFMKENSTKRMPLDLLRQFLLSYDRLESKLYTQGVEEFEQRRVEYNAWLSDQAKTHRELYVSSLFQFQYISAMEWIGSEDERLSQILKNYFEGIDFSDSLIIRSRELSKFMDNYMRLYVIQAKTPESRDSLFVQAGSAACEKASQGHPKVYDWMADYFYKGYETYHIDKGMVMLRQHINNPNCLSSKKQQIIKRLESIAKLVPGVLSPNFVISDNEGNNFEFHKWRGKARYKLLLFWTTNCGSCQRLVNELKQWYNEPRLIKPVLNDESIIENNIQRGELINKEKLDIIAVCLDKMEARKWETAIANLSGWKHLHIKGEVNSSVINDYAVLSTPAMFLIESESNIIVSSPGNLEQLIKDLQKGANKSLVNPFSDN